MFPTLTPRYGDSGSPRRGRAVQLPPIEVPRGGQGTRSGVPISPLTWKPAYDYPTKSAYPHTFVTPRVNAYSLDGHGAPALSAYEYACPDPNCSLCQRFYPGDSGVRRTARNVHGFYNDYWRNYLHGVADTHRSVSNDWMLPTGTFRPYYDSSRVPGAMDSFGLPSARLDALYSSLRDSRSQLQAAVNHSRALQSPYPGYYPDYDYARPLSPYDPLIL